MATDTRRRTDEGVGGGINFLTSQNLFVIVSDRGTNEGRQKAHSQRFGYEFKGKRKLGAFLVDHQNGMTPVYSGFWGSSSMRFIGIYDPENVYNTNGKAGGTFVSQLYLSLGNGGLPQYTVGEQLSTEFIETARTNLSRINSFEDLFADSSNTYRASTPPLAYLNIPIGPISDFGKVKYDITPADRFGKDYDIWDGFMIRVKRGIGIGFIGDFTKDTKGINHIGGGAGIKVSLGEGRIAYISAADQTAKLAVLNAGITF